MAPVRRRRKQKKQKRPNGGEPTGFKDLPYELLEPIYRYVLDFSDQTLPLDCPVRRAPRLAQDGQHIPRESFYRGLSLLAVSGAIRDEARRAIARLGQDPTYYDVFGTTIQYKLTHDGPTPDDYIAQMRQSVPYEVRVYLRRLVIHMDHMNCLHPHPRSDQPVQVQVGRKDIADLFWRLPSSRGLVTIWCPTFEEGWKFLKLLPCFYHNGALDRLLGVAINDQVSMGRWNTAVGGIPHPVATILSRFPAPAIWARDWAEVIHRHIFDKINIRLEFPVSAKKMAHVTVYFNAIGAGQMATIEMIARKNAVCGWSYYPRQRPGVLPDRLRVPDGRPLRRSARLNR